MPNVLAGNVHTESIHMKYKNSKVKNETPPCTKVDDKYKFFTEMTEGSLALEGARQNTGCEKDVHLIPWSCNS